MGLIQAGIIGAAGYTGGELIRLLLQHPHVRLAFAQSKSNAGQRLDAVHGDLVGETDLVFTEAHHTDIDVLFLCAGHGQARKFLQENELPARVHVIDIGNDFRLSQDAIFGDRKFVYGLPELNRDHIRTAKSIANPGCFATAIQLGLLPLAALGLLGEVYTTGITGSTGAGQSLSATSHFSWRQNNIQAYKTLEHQHLGEITESLNQLMPHPTLQTSARGAGIRFVPWRGDFTRGIFISSMLQVDLDLTSLQEAFHSFYASATFTHVTQAPLFLKQVVNTNKCLIQLELQGDTLVVHSCIDNLLKGASGQAVQNMNLMFGFEENAGLQLKGSYF